MSQAETPKCLHCGHAADEILFEGQTDAEWEAGRGAESSLMNANYFNREYRREKWMAGRTGAFNEASVAVAVCQAEWGKDNE